MDFDKMSIVKVIIFSVFIKVKIHMKLKNIIKNNKYFKLEKITFFLFPKIKETHFQSNIF